MIEMKEIMEKQILEMYPELGDSLNSEFLENSAGLGGLKQMLKGMGVQSDSGIVTHVGKVDGGILLGITLRGFDNPEVAYESRKKMHKMPVMVIC